MTTTTKQNDATPHASGTKLDAYSIRAGKHGTVWTRCGCAYVNRDGSLNLYLEVLPLDGRVHLRLPRPESTPATTPAAAAAA